MGRIELVGGILLLIQLVDRWLQIVDISDCSEELHHSDTGIVLPIRYDSYSGCLMDSGGRGTALGLSTTSDLISIGPITPHQRVNIIQT